MNVIQATSTLTHSFPLAIVVSRFNEIVTQALLEGALARARELGFHDDHITVVHVPGAVEIPIVAKRLAQSQQYRAIVTLGAVIRGETSHYDYVCDIVSQGCLQISLEHNVPVIFGVLTTENDEQALDRCGGSHGHKGVYAVDAAVEMATVLSKI